MLKLKILLCFQLTLIMSAPLQFPLLQPLQGTMQQQQLALQEQILALKQFQALQSINAIPSFPTLPTTNTQPLLVLFPNIDFQETKINTKNHPDFENKDEDSITIDSQNDDDNQVHTESPQMKAVLLVPDARLSIGGIISSIPFLPIEINVPDSLSWIYSIIAGWFTPQQNQENQNVKLLKFKNHQMPVVVVPLSRPVLY